MTQLRCTLGALLGLALAACGDDPTVVSLNISYADDVEAPAEVHVLLTQGSNKLDETFPAPTNKEVVEEVTIDVADRGYFKRYDLSGWADGEATFVVELKSAGGAVYMTDEGTFKVVENGVVAAYAEFKIEEPDDTSSDTSSEATDSGSDVSTAPSSTAGDASTSAAADSSTGDAQATDAATDSGDGDASSTEAGASDAASTDDASTEDAQ